MEFVRRLWADPETMAPVGGPILLSEAEARSWFARIVDPGRETDCFCLIRLPDGRPAGEISFHRLDVRSMTAELNVKVVSRERGRGIGREALRVFLAWYFLRFGGRRLVDDVALGNAAGQAALEGFGFRRVPSGAGAARFTMSREEFEALPGAGISSRGARRGVRSRP